MKKLLRIFDLVSILLEKSDKIRLNKNQSKINDNKSLSLSLSLHFLSLSLVRIYIRHHEESCMSLRIQDVLGFVFIKRTKQSERKKEKQKEFIDSYLCIFIIFAISRHLHFLKKIMLPYCRSACTLFCAYCMV